MHNELNENVERLCGKIYFFVVKVSFVGLVLIPLVTTILNYLVGDMNEESYALPSPITYVSRLCYAINSNGGKRLFFYSSVFDSLLKDAIRLAYTVRIYFGDHLRRCGHYLCTALSDSDRMLFRCIMPNDCRISSRYKKRCITSKCWWSVGSQSDGC